MINIEIDPSIEINNSLYILSYYSTVERKQVDLLFNIPQDTERLKSTYRVVTKGNYPSIALYKLYIEVEQLTQHDLTSLD